MKTNLSFRASLVRWMLENTINAYFAAGEKARAFWWAVGRRVAFFFPGSSYFREWFLSGAIAKDGWANQVGKMAGQIPADRRRAYTHSFIQALFWTKSTRRSSSEQNGCPVPVVMILSLTGACNLRCAGCYAAAFNRSQDRFDLENVTQVVSQGRDLGIRSYLLVGGEPMLFGGLFEIPRRFPDLMFFLFTNSTMVGPEQLDQIEKLTNVFLVLSTDFSDERLAQVRGTSAPESVRNLEWRLNDQKIPYAKSIVVNKVNLAAALEKKSVERLFTGMCRAVVMLKYVGEDASLALTNEQIAALGRSIKQNRQNAGGFVMYFPFDELAYLHRCGKIDTVLHIAPDGAVEPCPFDRTNLGNALEEPLVNILRRAATAEVGRCENACGLEMGS